MPCRAVQLARSAGVLYYHASYRVPPAAAFRCTPRRLRWLVVTPFASSRERPFFFFFFLLPPGATEALSLSQQENSLDQLVTATSSCTTVEYHTRSCDVVRFFYRTISSLYCQFRIFTNYNYVNCMIASWGERGQR